MKHHCKEIAIDFVKELAESEGFNTILVVTDQFTEVKYDNLVWTTWTIADVADSYITQICRLYSLSRYITSDRGLQFASKFFYELD